MGIQFDGINNEIKSQTKIDFPGGVGVAGTLTYEDVANVDSIGIITARTGINIGPTAGVAGTFFADGSYVTAGIITAGSYRGDGSQLSGIAVGGASSITFNDNVGLYFGAGNNNGPDLEIIHEPSALVTSFKVHTNDAQFSKRGGNKVARFSTTGVSYLYYDDSIRLETTSSGMSLSGDISIADKIVHTGDTHTAIRFAGNDIITTEIAGSETLRIDGTGLKIVDKLIHSGDVDTTIRFPAADTISAETGGTERLRITSDGKIGINNNNPIHAVHIKSVMSSSPSYIHMTSTGSNVNGGGGGIAFDTSAANTDETKFIATIAGIRNTAGDGSNDLVFSTTKMGVNGGAPTEKLRIDSSGYVTKPNTPFFSVYGTANNQTYNQGTDISFENVIHNVGSHFKMTSGTGQYQRFYAPVAGVYIFTFGMFPNAASNCRISLTVNGGVQTNPYISGCFTAWGTGVSVPMGSQMLKLSANDYVTVQVQIGTLTNTYDGHTGFQGFLLG